MKVQQNRIIGRERVSKFHLCDFEGFHKRRKEEKKYSTHVLREQTIFGIREIRISKFIRPTKAHRNISKKDPISFENNIIFQY